MVENGPDYLKTYDQIQSRKVRWIWYPYIALEKITLLQGDPGDGKSTMMLNLIAELSKAGHLPNKTKITAPIRSFKAIGQLVMTDRGLGLRFDLKEAVMFDAKPEEYINPKTGEKKRRIKYYPDQYKERYGKTYSDYMASHPTQDYEPFDDYITSSLGKTYSDAMKDKAKAEAAKTETMENPAGNLPGAYLGGNDDAGTAIAETGSIQTDNIL